MREGSEATTGSTSGEEWSYRRGKRLWPAFWSRAAALLRVSLVPEDSTAVGNAGARGAGHWGPFAEGTRQPPPRVGLEIDPGPCPGRRGIQSLVRGLGSEVTSPHVSPAPAVLKDASRTCSAQPAGISANPPGLPFRVPCRLLAALRAVPPQDCPGTPWYSLCRSRRPGWWSEWADFTASWSL